MVLNDEAHHVHDEKLKGTDHRTAPLRDPLRTPNDPRAGVVSQLEYSATPKYEKAARSGTRSLITRSRRPLRTGLSKPRSSARSPGKGRARRDLLSTQPAMARCGRRSLGGPLRRPQGPPRPPLVSRLHAPCRPRVGLREGAAEALRHLRRRQHRRPATVPRRQRNCNELAQRSDASIVCPYCQDRSRWHARRFRPRHPDRPHGLCQGARRGARPPVEGQRAPGRTPRLLGLCNGPGELTGRARLPHGVQRPTSTPQHRERPSARARPTPSDLPCDRHVQGRACRRSRDA